MNILILEVLVSAFTTTTRRKQGLFDSSEYNSFKIIKL